MPTGILHRGLPGVPDHVVQGIQREQSQVSQLIDMFHVSLIMHTGVFSVFENNMYFRSMRPYVCFGAFQREMKTYSERFLANHCPNIFDLKISGISGNVVALQIPRREVSPDLIGERGCSL